MKFSTVTSSTLPPDSRGPQAAPLPSARPRPREGKRVLVAHAVSPGRTGGMSRLMGFIHDEVAAADGWEVDYFCADRLSPNIRGLAARFVFPMQIVRHAREAYRHGRPYSIINVHEPSAAALVSLKKLAGRPCVVVTSHGLEQRVWELHKTEAKLGRRQLGWRSRLARPPTILWPSWLALKGANHIFCLNEEDKSYLQNWLGLPGGRITRLFPGAMPIFAEAAAGRSYGVAEKLLFAGTWRHNKGILDMVPAFEILAAKWPALTLTVLGSGLPREEVLSAFSDVARVRVKVIPANTEAEAARSLAEADIFVLPSLFEGTPLTLIEAMASGLPIVTTETCGMRDVIHHRRNGLLVPVRSPAALVEGVSELKENFHLREALGWQARMDAGNLYTWSRVAEPVRAAYAALESPTFFRDK